jgi:hypothetical protein
MLKSCSVLLVLVPALNVLAAPPVIYGVDNRQEVFEAKPLHQKLASSTAVMIDKKKLIRTADKPGLVQTEQTTLRQWLESQFEEDKSMKLSKDAAEAVDQRVSFCEGERFTEQPNPATCSGFLIGPDLLVTAGHCVAVPNFCEDYSWVFDFQVDPETKLAGIDMKEENVYGCKTVLSTVLANNMGLDYGLIQLDRKVTGREVLAVRSQGKLADTENLVVIGAPSGLPTKVSPGANVRKNVHPFFFVANLDTFQGNSGSAVFDADTGVVEGILVRGEEDFEANMGLMCIEAKRCDDSGCRGEDVSRMTSIPEVAVKDALFEIAAKGDVRELEKLTKTKFWIDIYGADGKTALMKASENLQKEFADKLLTKGANPKLQDVNGYSALHMAAPKLTKKNSDLIKVLLKAGAEMEAKNTQGETALLVAARSLNLEGVKLLISQGADKNATDKSGENALFAFSRSGDKKAVSDLIALGVDSTVKNNQGQSVDDVKKPGLLARLKK